MSSPVAGVAATNPAVVTGDRSGRQDVANTAADRKPFEVMLNLTRSATRGEKSTNDSQMIRVPARLLECRMTLPLGSSDGLYYVQVQRAVQSEVLKTAQGNATINDGDVRLNVELDLSNMAAGRYLLSYRHAGESWHRVPIVITRIRRPRSNVSVGGSTRPTPPQFLVTILNLWSTTRPMIAKPMLQHFRRVSSVGRNCRVLKISSVENMRPMLPSMVGKERRAASQPCHIGILTPH